MQLVFLPTFSTPCMDHLLYLMFRCDGDVMERLEILWELNTALMAPFCLWVCLDPGKVGRKSHIRHCSTL